MDYLKGVMNFIYYAFQIYSKFFEKTMDNTNQRELFVESDHEINDLKLEFLEFVILENRFSENCITLANYVIAEYVGPTNENDQRDIGLLDIIFSHKESYGIVKVSSIMDTFKAVLWWCLSKVFSPSRKEEKALRLRQQFVDGFDRRYSQVGTLSGLISSKGEGLRMRMIKLLDRYSSASLEIRRKIGSKSRQWNYATAISGVLGILVFITVAAVARMMTLTPMPWPAAPITYLVPIIVTPATVRRTAAIGIAVTVVVILYGLFYSQGNIQLSGIEILSVKEELENMQKFLLTIKFLSEICKQEAEKVHGMLHLSYEVEEEDQVEKKIKEMHEGARTLNNELEKVIKKEHARHKKYLVTAKQWI